MKAQLFAIAILVLPGVAAADAVNDSFTRMLTHQPTASAATTNEERLVENWVNAAVRGDTDAATDGYARLLQGGGEPPRHEPVRGQPDDFAAAVREALQAGYVNTAIASAP